MRPTTTLPALLLAFLSAAAGAADTSADTTFTVGAGVAAVSSYAGSDQRLAAPILLLDYDSAYGFYLSTMRGIGYAAEVGPVQASASLGLRGGRSEKGTRGFGGRSGSAALRGMGDVRGSATANFAIELPLSRLFSAGARLEAPLSRRASGNLLTFGIKAGLLDARDDEVGVGLSLRVGDADFLQTWYGVSAAQSAASGYRAYSPRAGLHGIDLELPWTHRFGGGWRASTAFGVQHLLRDAAASPIVRRRTTPTAAVFLGYRF